MHTRLKVVLSDLLRVSGLFGALEQLRDATRVVFTLHRVLCREEAAEVDNPHLVLTADVFEEFLQFLQERSDIVPLRELQEARDAGLHRRKCAITFDDGWEDNFRVALPILRKYNIHATVFLATGYVGSLQDFPENRLRRKLKEADQKGVQHEIRHLLAANGIGGARSDLHHMHREFKKLTHARKLEILQEADRILPAESSLKRLFLTWDEVRSMATAGVTFESHTVNHILLGVEHSEERIATELIASKRRIREEAGYDPTMFAYPSGSFNERAMHLVAEAGYSAAFTTEPGPITAESHSLRLPRVAIDNDLLVDEACRFRKSRAQFHLLKHTLRGQAETSGA